MSFKLAIRYELIVQENKSLVSYNSIPCKLPLFQIRQLCCSTISAASTKAYKKISVSHWPNCWLLTERCWEADECICKATFILLSSASIQPQQKRDSNPAKNQKRPFSFLIGWIVTVSLLLRLNWRWAEQYIKQPKGNLSHIVYFICFIALFKL